MDTKPTSLKGTSCNISGPAAYVECEEAAMESKSGGRVNKVDAGVGIFWFIGWLFTIAFAKLLWWQAILGLVIWPYYLGLAVR